MCDYTASTDWPVFGLECRCNITINALSRRRVQLMVFAVEHKLCHKFHTMFWTKTVTLIQDYGTWLRHNTTSREQRISPANVWINDENAMCGWNFPKHDRARNSLVPDGAVVWWISTINAILSHMSSLSSSQHQGLVFGQFATNTSWSSCKLGIDMPTHISTDADQPKKRAWSAHER